MTLSMEDVADKLCEAAAECTLLGLEVQAERDGLAIYEKYGKFVGCFRMRVGTHERRYAYTAGHHTPEGSAGARVNRDEALAVIRRLKRLYVLAGRGETEA